MTLQVGSDGKAHQGTGGRKEAISMTGFVEILVESAFGIAHPALHAPGRGPAQVAFARQVAIYLSHVRLGLSYSAAGRFFGRDRTTAAHACRVIEERREESSLDSLLDCLERAIDMRRQADAAWSDRA
jgi:chromosomal replication initiation ATPase DnaA